MDLNDQPELLEQAVAAARQELRWSRLEGTVGLLLYVGRVDRQRPAADLLRRIDRMLPRFDLVVLLDDADARKWHWGREKVEKVAVCFLSRVLVDPVLREWLADVAAPAAEGSADGVPSARCLTVGMNPTAFVTRHSSVSVLLDIESNGDLCGGNATGRW